MTYTGLVYDLLMEEGVSYMHCVKCDQLKPLKFFKCIGADGGGGFRFSANCVPCDDPLDQDIHFMGWDERGEEIKRLRAGIRQHRDASGHDLCWYVPELWSLLPEKIEPKPAVPPTPEFLSCCAKYRASLDPTSPKEREPR